MMMSTKMMMVMVVMVVALLHQPTTDAASMLTLFSRGFERQEEIQTRNLNTGSGWESRQVPGKVWACTGQQGAASEGQITFTDQIDAFKRLFGYIDGANNRGEKLTMGKPVSIEVKTAADGSREVNACFFLPERVQADPPTPTNALVFLSQRPNLTIFTRRFGGFVTDEDEWMAQSRGLKRVLTAEGIETRDDLQYWNAYDPPHKFWFRRNEVWMVKPEEQQVEEEQAVVEQVEEEQA